MNVKNIYIIGPITTETIKDVIVDLNEHKNINKLDELNIYISSEGGDLYSCLGMIDFIKQQQKSIGYKISTYGIGEIASGGFFLFTLGDKRFIYPMCRIFVHEHMVIEADQIPYSEKLSDLKEEKILNNLYVNTIAESLKISKKDCKTLLKKNKWLTKKEIDRYNIITGDINE